jgi:hypothetical protein
MPDRDGMLVEGLSRREFLVGLGAAGVGGALAGPGALARPAAAATRTMPAPGISPTELSFAIKAQYRPFEVVASGFVAVDDTFDGGAVRPDVLAPAPELDPGRARSGGGTLAVSGTSFFALYRTAAGPVAPYAAVQIEVASLRDGPERARNTVYAGLVRDAANYVVASYDRTTKTVAVRAVNEGRQLQLIEAPAALRAPFTFAVVLNENNVIALADTGDGFRPLVRANVASVLDLRDPGVLRRYRYGYGVRASSGTIVLDAVRAGYWGKAGVRDPHVVTWADGTPYVADGKVYLTLTNAGLGFFQFAHWGVYTLDLANFTSPDALREVGKVFFQRGGRIVGDHAGHIVYDPAIRAFRVLATTWGTFSGNGVAITSAVVGGDPLHGVTVVREPSILPLPTEVSRWDPHIVRIGRRWWVAFVESPSQNPFVFHPALARGPRSAEFGGLRLVGRDLERTMTEGMVMQKIGGRWYVLCSSSRDEGPSGGRYRIYDLRMRFVGFLHAPYPTNIPHPMVFPVAIPGHPRTRYLLVTFNGTQYHESVLGYGTHGDFFVMEATGRRSAA